MKKKLVIFLVATIIYTLMSIIIYFFVDNTYSNQQIVLMSVFFGISMGFFEVLIRPIFTKYKNKE